MRKLVKVVLGIALFLVVVVAGAAVVAPMVVDPNDYRDEIARVVKERTGRDLEISGDLELSVFPWLGVSVGRASIGNAPGFEAEHFASLDAAEVRVKLLPLLRKVVEMDTVEVRGLSVHLARRADGTTNWDDLVRVAAAGGESQPSPGAPPVAALALGGLDLSSAEVVWDDEVAGHRVRLSNLSVRTGPLTLDAPIDAEFELDVEVSGAQALAGHVAGGAEVGLDLVSRVHRLNGLAIDATLAGDAIPGGSATLALRGDATFDETAQRLDVAGLSLDAKGLAVAGVAGDVSASADVALRLAEQAFEASGLAIAASLGGDALPGGRVDLTARGDVRGDLAAQTFAADGLAVEIPSLALEGASASVSARADVRADLAARTVTASGLALDVGSLAIEGARGSVAVRGDVAGNLAEQRWALSGMSAKGDLAGEAVANGTLAFDVAADVIADLAARTFAAKGLQAAGTLKSEDAPGGELTFALGGDAAYDAEADTATLTDFRLAADDLKASGTLKAERLGDAPAVNGTLKVARFDLKSLLGKLGQPVPETSDPDALRAVSVDTTLAATPSSVKLDPMVLVVDGATVRGRASVPDFATTAASFDLTVDAIDADRYLPPRAAGGEAPPPTPGAAAAAATGLPVDAIRALDVDGRLRAGKLRVRGLDLADVDVGIAAKAGLVDLQPLKASLYGGRYAGHVVLDARGERATLSLDESIEGVRADRAVKDLGIDVGGLDLSGGKSDLALSAKASGDVATQSYRFEELKVSADIAGKSFPGGRLAFGLGADIAVDLGKDRMSARKALLVLGDFTAKGDVEVEGLTTAPAYSAKLDVPTFNARKLLAHLGQKVDTADKKALTSAAIDATVKGTATSVDFESLDVRVDDTRMKGSLALRNLDPLAVGFDLDVDSIDLDRYLPPKRQKQAATPGAAAAALPVETLRHLQADGRLVVGKLRVAGVSMSDVQLVAKAKDGKLTLNPLGAKLYEGTYSGNVRVDATGKAPVIDVDEKLTGVQAGPLLEAVAGSRVLSGTTNASMRLSAVGNDADALKRTLDGDVAMRVLDGSIYGVDVLGSLCGLVSGLAGLQATQGGLNAESLLIGALGLAAGADAAKKSQGGENRTDFAELSGTVRIDDGIARNRDLSLQSPVVRVTGEGGMNLATEEVDYLARPAIVSSCKGQGGLTFTELSGVELPVRLTGRIPNVKVSPQFDRAVVRRAAREEQPATRETRKTRRERQQAQEQETAPQKPEDVLKEGLKGILKGGGLFN